jgi:FkbM family methyltransferase
MLNLKGAIQKLVNLFGYEIKRPLPKCGEEINLLDLAVRSSLSSADRFFVLQIGANDGSMDDPIHSFIVRHNLDGLLVEPLPDCFERLCMNYADQPQLLFENCAISDQDGERDLYRLVQDNPFPPRAQGLASFDQKVLIEHKRFLPDIEQYIEVVKVPTMTPKSLFEKHNVTKVDLLQVDSEGYDYEIIKMILDTNIFPKIINYEHIHLSRKDQVNCRRLLMSKGFRFAQSERDTLAVAHA